MTTPALALIHTLAVLGPESAAAQTWEGTTSTDWTVGSNWVGGAVPTGSSAVQIDTTSPNAPVLGVTGAVASSASSLSIGDGVSASGSLTIQSGSNLTFGSSVRLGDRGTGIITVTGANSILTTNYSSNLAALIVGNFGGSNGTLNIENSGSVSVPNQRIVIGDEANATGTINIRSGGTLTSNKDAIIGGQNGNTGTGFATVTGSNSLWTVGQDLYVGNGGTGTLAIENQGKVTAARIIVGVTAGASGTLDIKSGGRMTSNANEAHIGKAAGSTGHVTVGGTNSEWNAGSHLYVGYAGQGTLNIENGGSMTAGGIGRIAEHVGSTGQVNVSGGSSWTLNANTLIVGTRGDGRLKIDGGSRVSVSTTVGGYILIGSASTATGDLSVTGGSTLTTPGFAQIGREGAGTATVSGAESQWTVGDVGVTVATLAGSSGTLDVRSSGVLVTSALTRGVGAAAQVTFDGGILRATGPSASFISGFTGSEFEIASGGMTLDSDGHDVTATSPLTGAGTLTKSGGGTLTLNGSNSYSGGTFVNAGTLAVEANDNLGASSGGLTFNGGTLQVTGTSLTSIANSRNVTWGAGGGGFDIVEASNTFTVSQTLDSGGALTKKGAGTLVLTANNSYSGATTISAGTLQLGDGGTSGSIAGDVANNGTLTFKRSDTLIYADTVSGLGELHQAGSGTTALTGDSTYTGGTTISAGTLQIGDEGRQGNIIGDVANNGMLAFYRTDWANPYSFGGEISGSGTIEQAGSGKTELTGDSSSFTGTTQVTSGVLLADGTLGGTVHVAGGGTLSGTGKVAGDTTVASGGKLEGRENETLTIGGDLVLNSGADVTVSLGVPDNDTALFDVANDLTLDGTLNVTSYGGFGPGHYRLFDYGGNLTNNVLTIGTTPHGVGDHELSVDTATGGQVDLISTAGAILKYWDGDEIAHHGNGTADGGDGTWDLSNNNWTDKKADVNGAWVDGLFAIFMGQAGTVTVDDGGGTISVAGMQFAVDRYTVKGDNITLGKHESIIRTGTGGRNDPHVSATIASKLTGSGRLVKTDFGTLILAADNTYTGGTTVREGTLQIGNGGTSGSIKGNVANDGTLRFDRTDKHTFGGSIYGKGRLEQAGSGTLTLTAASTYTGGTSIASGSTLQLGDGGTSGQIVGDVDNNGAFIVDRSNTLALNGVISGTGSFTQAGSGTTVLTGQNTYTGKTLVKNGTLAAGGAGVFSAASDYDVRSGATLALRGHDQTLASLQNAGMVRLGSPNAAPGTTLTVAGDYTGKSGTIHLNTVLGGDNSVTDRLHVEGNTSGSTILAVTNAGGKGAPTNQGIKLVDVDGASRGSFTLAGHYTFKGDPAVVGGAYAYRLFPNAPDAQDGDWYLRSTLEHPKPKPPKPPHHPHYQPGAPVYEAYGQALLGFNAVGTLRERLGSRIWREDNPDMTTAATPLGSAPEPIATPSGTPLRLGTVWGRIEAAHGSYDPRHATSSMDYDTDIWKLQAGLDGQLYETGAGDLIGGLFGQYGTVSADVASPHGHGTIDATGYGLGGTLTWFGADGVYLDALAQATWYDSDLTSGTAKRDLARDNDGFGYALSLEAGKAFTLTPSWSLTPQAQLVYSAVDFDSFTDPFGARVEHKKTESLKGRAGAAIGHHATWRDTNGQAAATHLYGIANLSYEMLDGRAAVDLAGTDFATAKDRLWGGLGLGGSYSWADNKYALHGELALDTSLQNFADNYKVTGNVGIKIRW